MSAPQPTMRDALRAAGDSLRYTVNTTAPNEVCAALSISAFLRAAPATMRPWGMDESDWRSMCVRWALQIERDAADV